MSFNASDWYWLADDKRLYTSARHTQIQATDQGYLDFLAAGNVPTQWPRDATDVQTDAALEAVLNFYGLTMAGGPVPVVLAPLTPRQIRLALLGANLLDQVEAAVKTLSPADQIQWNYASSYERNNPLIASMATALTLTQAAVDTLWQSAMVL